MKKILFGKNGVNGHQPFWEPWGCFGCLWRLLLFLFLLLAMLFLLSLFRGCRHSHVDLPDEFTSADMAKCAGIPKPLAQEALKLLYDLGLVARIGKEGRSILYRAYEEL